ncbi:MAG TPA: hypothetical protein VFH10_17285 [Nocardioides sp.]|uniref:hypothetical protein n=1 Tax=Nocardioides sp. TaxID=35761 RepID=UPI002D7F8914|nr:hypothetical protein [Nocardioides sp.]HET6654394.1 hypothetical protein [Nocardioides sp.]
MTRYVLLPSPLVGAATWRPVAEVLRAGGASVAVASTDGCTTPEQVQAAYVAAVPPGDGAMVLVPHSNAGYLAANVAAAVGSAGVVYVDAALPASTGPTTLAPSELLDFLAGLADEDGVLPPWTQWWDDSDGLFPDDATRAEVEADQSRLPLAYFRSAVRPPTGWTARPSGYLAFGDTYAEELERAISLGWPTRVLEGGHLHQLHDPAAVAAGITELSSRIA